MTANAIYTGYLSSEVIEAGSITANKLSAEVGQVLDIGSNKALNLYATVNGSRPAGTLKTTDASIEIIAGKNIPSETEGGEPTVIPAKINIDSGGELNLNGGNVNISSGGKLDIQSSGAFELRANGADSLNSKADGIYISSENGINIGGGKIYMSYGTGNTSTIRMNAGSIFLGERNGEEYSLKDAETFVDGTKFSLDAAAGTIDIKANSSINIAANQTLSLLAGGNVIIGSADPTKAFTVGADSNRAYIYNGMSTLDSTAEGIYIGTDGISIGGGKFKYSLADDTLYVQGDIQAETGGIGGWNISEHRLSSGTNRLYVGLDSGTTNQDGSLLAYAIWAGDSSPDNAPFRVSRIGEVIATKMTIENGTITNKNGTNVMFSVSSEGKVLAKDLTIEGGSITIKSKGTTNFSVTATGSLTAKLGTVGGWFISNAHIGNDAVLANSTIGLALDYGANIVFWAGGKRGESPKFAVTANGKLTATDADITGIITATSGSFTGTITASNGEIGGWVITETSIEVNAKTANYVALSASDDIAIRAGGKMQNSVMVGAFFYVKKDGTIYAEKGTIGGWNLLLNRLYSGTSAGYVALDSDDAWSNTAVNPITKKSGDWSQPYAIWCGASSATDAPFRVRRDGTVYLNAVLIKDGDDYKVVNLTRDFSDAVAYSSGSWDGNTFTAKLSFFNGEITRGINLSTSVSVISVRTDGGIQGTGTRLGTVRLSRSVGSVSKPTEDVFTTVKIDAHEVYADGWHDAASLVDYSPDVNPNIIRLAPVDYTEGYTLRNFNISATYNTGWFAAGKQVNDNLPSRGTGESFVVKIPSQTAPGTLDSRTFTMKKGTPSAAGGYASVMAGYSNNVVAQIDISNWYTKGHEDGVSETTTELRPNSISQDTDKKQVTVLNAAGDSIGGPYSANDIYQQGVTDANADTSTAWQDGWNEGYAQGVSDGISSGWTAAATGCGRSGNSVTYPTSTYGVKQTATASLNGAGLTYRYTPSGAMYDAEGTAKTGHEVWKSYSPSSFEILSYDTHALGWTTK